MLKEQLEPLLLKVQKPIRYVGGEYNSVVKDKAGILSEILTIFANCGANILTINQSIPTGGRAMVTISAETSNLSCTLEALTQKIAERKGVVKADCVAG